MPQNMPSADPNDEKDYTFNWGPWLGTDTIVSQAVTASSGTIMSVTATTSEVTVWRTGGIAGTTVAVTCQIVTAGGRTAEDSIYIPILNK